MAFEIFKNKPKLASLPQAQPHYILNSINILFPRQTNIRRMSHQFEDKLKDNYTIPQVLGVPDEIDPDIPRIVFTSKHAFSQILISQVNISLLVRYSPEWQTNIDLGRDYLLKRAAILFDLLDLIKTQCNYFGLTTQVNMPLAWDDEKILQHLSDVFLRENIDGKSHHDFVLKLTKIIENKYFSNMTVQNFRNWNQDPNQSVPPKLASKSASERGITVVGDFNDRYVFNESKDYKSSRDQIKPVIEMGLKEMANAIKNING